MRIAVLFAVMCFAVSWPVTAQPAQEMKAGEKVQVREGDTWSAATILSKEGRRYQIRYEGADATEEWVSADRLRLAGAAGAAPSTLPTTPVAKSRTWKPRDKVQVKWGGLWRDAEIVKLQGEWSLVRYSGVFKEWVEPWRIREVGSTRDEIAYMRPNPAVRDDERPPRAKPGAPPEPERTTGDAKRQAKPDEPAATPLAHPITRVNTNAMKELLPTAPAGTWTPPIDPFDVKAPLTARPIPLKGGNRGFFQHRRETFIRNGRMGLLYEGGPGVGEKAIHFERVNLVSGASESQMEMTEPTWPVAISPDGNLIAAKGWNAKKDDKVRVDLWSSEGAKLKHVASFLPYEKEQSKNVAWCAFADDTHLLTANGDRSLLTCWEIPAAKALWQMRLDRNTPIWQSNTGKFLFLQTAEGLFVVDPLKGDALGVLDTGNRSLGDCALSPDGTRMVSVSRSILSIWDLQSGKFVDEVGLPVGVPGSGVECLDERFVLIGNSLLFDLKTLSPVWSYTGADGTISYGGRLFYFFGGKERPTLCVARLPHAAALKAADARKPAEMLVKPGMKVSLDVSIDAPDEQKKAIREQLAASLAEANITVEDNQPVKLIARTEDGTSEQRTYRTIGRFGGDTETVTVTQKITRLFYELDGKPIWETKTTNTAGFFLHLKKDESIADAAKGQFNIGFLKEVHVPTKVLKPADPLVAGTSQLLVGGPKDK